MNDPVLIGLGICKNFGGLRALANVGLQVQPEEIFSIIGPNGAGKTTLFNLISGVDQDFSGEIQFNKELISHKPSHFIEAKGIARTFQNVRLFKNLSVLENVMVGCHGWACPQLLRTIFFIRTTTKQEQTIREWAEVMLGLVGLEDKMDHEVESLPLGDQKLLEIARALATKPQILLLDEPGGGLNDSELDKLKQIIFKIKEEKITQMIIEHNINFIMHISDKIMVLDFGVKIAEGIPKDIICNDKVIEAYIGREKEFA
jgi:branched-chain amino acid transport system ATP-binding protein